MTVQAQAIINGYPVVRVTAMSDLGPGVMIFLTPCIHCQGTHQYLVIKLARAVMLSNISGQLFEGDVWVVDRPGCKFNGSRNGGIAIDPYAGIEASLRNVWRVIDPILEREKELAREKDQVE